MAEFSVACQCGCINKLWLNGNRLTVEKFDTISKFCGKVIDCNCIKNHLKRQTDGDDFKWDEFEYKCWQTREHHKIFANQISSRLNAIIICYIISVFLYKNYSFQLFLHLTISAVFLFTLNIFSLFCVCLKVFFCSFLINLQSKHFLWCFFVITYDYFWVFFVKISKILSKIISLANPFAFFLLLKLVFNVFFFDKWTNFLGIFFPILRLLLLFFFREQTSLPIHKSLSRWRLWGAKFEGLFISILWKNKNMFECLGRWPISEWVIAISQLNCNDAHYVNYNI